MPRTPIDYSKAVIYKIQHLEKDELVYVGSTTNFTKRKNKHKSCCKNQPTKLYEMIRENGGWECFNMIIIKEYPCQTKKELLQEEDCVMREFKSSLNTIRSYVSYEESLELMKEYNKKNKEEINKKQKIFYEKNKQKILKESKEYLEKNKEEINKRRRERYNKEEASKRNKEAYQKKKNNAINLKK